MYKRNVKLKNKSGFTLIEIMVATAIFMVIMLAAIGSLVVASDSAKKAQKLRFAMDNLSFAMESMSRSIRIGTNYTCVTSGTIDLSSSPAPSDCVAGNFIAFIPSKAPLNIRTGYRLDTRTDGTHSLQRCNETNTCVDIITPDIDIQVLKFFVTGTGTDALGNDDFTQPSAYITIKGGINIKGEWTSFALQTLTSQRSSE